MKISITSLIALRMEVIGPWLINQKKRQKIEKQKIACWTWYISLKTRAGITHA